MTVLVSDHKEARDARHVWPRRGERQGRRGSTTQVRRGFFE